MAPVANIDIDKKKSPRVNIFIIIIHIFKVGDYSLEIHKSALSFIFSVHFKTRFFF